MAQFKADDIDRQLAEVDYVRFTYADIHGIARGKTVPVRHAKRFLENGIGAYAGKLYWQNQTKKE